MRPQSLIVSRQSTEAPEPCKGSLDYPAPTQQYKAPLGFRNANITGYFVVVYLLVALIPSFRSGDYM